jgi:hypothetical protein
MSGLKQKYVIVGDEYIQGRVKFHRELNSKADCGGFWFYVEDTNTLFLYGASADFGGAMESDVEAVMDSVKERFPDGLTVHYKPTFLLHGFLSQHMESEVATKLMNENDWV